jgi:hypothetical protein
MCAAAGVPAPLLAVEPEIWRRYAGVILDGLKPGCASDLGHEPPDVAKIDAASALPRA